MPARKSSAVAAALVFAAMQLSAQTVTIGQIDSSRLLLNQEVDLYVSVVDETGVPVEGLSVDEFTVYESATGEEFQEVRNVREFKAFADRSQGINFLLLVDNSGSMYDTVEGTATDVASAQRITHAKRAIRTFLDNMLNPMDTVGLASFNTRYEYHTQPVQDKSIVAQALSEIEPPATSADAYTELYAALLMAIEDMSALPGRTAIIVLSDGENYPYSTHTGEAHPVYDDRVFTFQEPIDAGQTEGVSVFAVNFATAGDENLATIAGRTGGEVFDAAGGEELADVYLRIQDRILKEYLLTYQATMAPADRKYVRIAFRGDGVEAQDTRFYYSSTVFGMPLERLPYLLILPFLLALLLWWLLTKVDFEKHFPQPTLEVLDAQQGAPSTRMFSIDQKKTVIGGSMSDDVTIAGAPSVRPEHATIVYDETSKTYSVEGGSDIQVNNKPVTSKKLEPGDVINVGGTIIVFDEESEKRRQEKSPKKQS